MLLALGLANDAIKLPMTERFSIRYILRAAVYGQTFRRTGSLDGFVFTLLTVWLFGQMLTGHAGNIATVYVAVQGGGADSPLTVFLFDIHDGIYGDAQLDLLGYHRYPQYRTH